MFGMGATASDFNNDGFVDLNITDFGSPRTLMGMGDGTFVDATASSGNLISPSAERVTSWGTAFVDVDQDGWDDMVTAFGPVLLGLDGDWADTVDHPAVNDLDDSAEQVNAFFHNREGRFEDRSTEAGFDLLGASRALVTADFNGDGVPDVAISGMDSDLRQVVPGSTRARVDADRGDRCLSGARCWGCGCARGVVRRRGIVHPVVSARHHILGLGPDPASGLRWLPVRRHRPHHAGRW